MKGRERMEDKNNGFMPLYQRVKVLKKEDSSSGLSEEAKRIEKAGLVAPDSMKNFKNEAIYGELVAIGFSADETLRLGDIVTFGKYAGTEPAECEPKPEEGMEYRYMNDVDLLSIKLTPQEYNERFGI